MKIAKDLPHGGQCIVDFTSTYIQVTIKDSKGTLTAEFSTDGKGYPCIDIDSPKDTNITVQEYDPQKEDLGPVTSPHPSIPYNVPKGNLIVSTGVL